MFEDEENQSLKHIKTSTQLLGHTEHLELLPLLFVQLGQTAFMHHMTEATVRTVFAIASCI